MYTGINIGEIKKFVSKKDPSKERPTVFHISALDSFIKAHIEDSTTDLERDPANPELANLKIRYAERNILAVKFGVKKIEDFVDPVTKQPVTLEATEEVKISDMVYLALPNKIIAMLAREGLIPELTGAISELGVLSEEETKN